MALDSRYLKPFQEPVPPEVPQFEVESVRDELAAGNAGWKYGAVPMTQKESEELFKEFVMAKVNEDVKPTAANLKSDDE
jgi:hypothetical protein